MINKITYFYGFGNESATFRPLFTRLCQLFLPDFDFGNWIVRCVEAVTVQCGDKKVRHVGQRGAKMERHNWSQTEITRL